MRHVDVIGEKFGMLTVLEETQRIEKSGKKQYYVKCKCDCGNIKTINKAKLTSGRTKSCGCLQKAAQRNLGHLHMKPKGVSAFNETYTAYKRAAEKRGYPFLLTQEEFAEIVVKPCIYCGSVLTQEKRKKQGNGVFRYTGIDRYDNTKGYTVENSVPCCKVCNRIKTDMAPDELAERLQIIVSRIDIWRDIK